MPRWCLLFCGGLLAMTLVSGAKSETKNVATGESPAVIGHRGLMHHAPENSLSGFRACLDVRVGFEVDVQRTKDGQLICVHDAALDRTTDGTGKLAAKTLAEIKSLDAGGWFGENFRGEKVPTFAEVLDLVKAAGPQASLVAVDLKAEDIENDVVRLARERGVLDRLVFIGLAIDQPEVRRALRKADEHAPVACLAQTAEQLEAALADKDSDWAYLRFPPTAAQVQLCRAATKRVFVVGAHVAGNLPDNWKGVLAAGADAILTDFPLELAAQIRQTKTQTGQAAMNSDDISFNVLATNYVDEFTRYSPVGATSLGHHAYDHKLDEISPEARAAERKFYSVLLTRLEAIPVNKLSRQNQVNYHLLKHQLTGDIWRLDTFQEWAWNPIVYTQLTGGAIYSLMSREFAPANERLAAAASRLEQFPRLYKQIRQTLVPARVPRVHAETAIKQNRGVLNIIEQFVKPQIKTLTPEEQARLSAAIDTATHEVEIHQTWLEKELLPAAAGNLQIGAKLFDEKLKFSLGSRLSRAQIRERAEFELKRVRAEMYAIARGVKQADNPGLVLPETPTPDVQQQTIEYALGKAADDIPPRDGVLDAARHSLKLANDFVREKDLVTIPDDPLDIIVMPEFQRGVSVAYCDSPGPLEVGLKTFYAVAPLPEDWSDEQCRSFLREYNIRSIHNLTVHEAMPGHFLQIAHANRTRDRLRAVLSSGTFVEGWACYTEQMMNEEGFLDRDPLMRLVTLKWYLRTIANAILDQSLHVEGIRREDAMRLMMHDTFQEEREAAGKWIRAQVTSTQLSTYFVGVQEHRDLRAAAREKWGREFNLKRYHDGAISFGSPPVKYVRALLLDEPIPE